MLHQHEKLGGLLFLLDKYKTAIQWQKYEMEYGLSQHE